MLRRFGRIVLVLVLALAVGRLAAQISVLEVAAGGYHSLLLRSDGRVSAAGYNGYGGLGTGTLTSSGVFVAIPALTNIVAVRGGTYHSLAVRSDGTLWAFGYNGFGQLGNGGFANVLTPAPVAGIGGVAAVAAGDNHSLFLLTGGAVLAVGRNSSGQLGNGTQTTSPTPVATGITNAIAVAAGANHSLALLADGTVRAWGDNFAGQLGLGTTGTTVSTPTPIPGLAGVQAIAAGTNHSTVRLADGTLRAFGDNSYGQLGNGTQTTSGSPVVVLNATGITAIRAAGSHNLALKADGTLWSWGGNGYGQLGNGTNALGLAAAPVSIAGPIAAFAAGGSHSLAIGATGGLYSWGYDLYGQLANGGLSGGSLPGPMTRTWALYPGSAEGLNLATGVAGPATAAPPFDLKTATVGQAVTVTLSGAAFAANPGILAAEVFLTGTPPQPLASFPVIHLHPALAFVIADTSPFPLGVNGIAVGAPVPAGLAGQSLMLQGVAVSASAANGFFAASDGHELRFL